METVTGQPLKSEVLQLAEKIVELVKEYTSSAIMARAAIQIADTVISSEEPSAKEDALFAEAHVR